MCDLTNPAFTNEDKVRELLATGLDNAQGADVQLLSGSNDPNTLFRFVSIRAALLYYELDLIRASSGLMRSTARAATS